MTPSTTKEQQIFEHEKTTQPGLASNIRQAVLEGLSLPVAVVNDDGELKEANTLFNQFVNADEQIYDGVRSLTDNIIPVDHERISAALSACLAADLQNQHLKTAILTPGGKITRVRIELKRIPNSRKIVVTIFDIHNQSRTEDDLSKRAEELENLFYLISHNMKSPILSIQGFVKLIAESSESKMDEEMARYISRIGHNADRISRMIQNILDYSQASRDDFNLKEVNLQNILFSIKAECLPRIKESSIELHIAENPPKFMADQKSIYSVFYNLVENAIKYIGAPQHPKIEVGWEEKNRFYVFWVKDNGPGIPERFHESVFELFERALAPGSTEGTGVGLAIVKRIIERHSGCVRLASDANGTTIFFSLPKKISSPT